MGKNKKSQNNKNLTIASVLILVVILAVAGFYLSPKGETPSTTVTNPTVAQWNCGELQVVINSVIEASGYYRNDSLKPAVTDYKFEILDITVTNEGTTTDDLSGGRIILLSGNSTYSPQGFSHIERIVLPDNSITAYDCRELNLSSVSRFVLGAGESSRGCKIFQVLKDSDPISFSVYELDKLKCTIPV